MLEYKYNMALDIEKLNDSPHLLDILIQMEDVLDSLDLYVFSHWMKGELVEGPIVRRYWFDMTLRYGIDEMPDPRGAMRLIKHGVRVDYNKATVEEDGGEEPKEPNFWEIKISVPKRLVSDMNAAELDFYDDEIDIEDVQDAQDVGMDDESTMMSSDDQADNLAPDQNEDNEDEDI
jgi:hypothetical protein